jgi:hypothetical protein
LWGGFLSFGRTERTVRGRFFGGSEDGAVFFWAFFFGAVNAEAFAFHDLTSAVARDAGIPSSTHV